MPEPTCKGVKEHPHLRLSQEELGGEIVRERGKPRKPNEGNVSRRKRWLLTANIIESSGSRATLYQRNDRGPQTTMDLTGCRR